MESISIPQGTQIVPGILKHEEISLPVTIKMEIEVSRRKLKCSIEDREGLQLGWFDTIHECFYWLEAKGIVSFYCDSPSGKWIVKLSNIPGGKVTSYG